MKTRSLKLPRELEGALTSYAQARGTSSSSVVREALAEYLATPTGRLAPASSFGARAADLAGCVEGPADLASNPGHLAAYGAVARRRPRPSPGRSSKRVK